MRLGAHFKANTIEELEPLCEVLDKYRLSAVSAPNGFENWTEDECYQFGEKAKKLNVVIGEAGFWENLMDPNEEALEQHIQHVRKMLINADIMGVKGIVTLVGSFNSAEGPLSHDSRNFSEEAKKRYRDICLKLIDGLELKNTKYITEPWHNTFYYQPEDILEFLHFVDDTRVALHLDMMNMVSQQTYHKTTEHINKTFDMLSDYIVSVHAKDLKWRNGLFIHIDEVKVGDGVMDYETFLKRIDALDKDMPVYTEHWQNEEDWLDAISCLHQVAEKAGKKFITR